MQVAGGPRYNDPNATGGGGGGGSALTVKLDGANLDTAVTSIDATDGLFASAVSHAITMSTYGTQAGVLASRPAAARSNKYGLYYATDTKTCYVSTGAVWTTLFTLGTISSQDANNVTITGGSITGITDLAVADGGTGASTAAGARTNLGLGTADSPQFTGVEVGNASDTTVSRASAGDIAVEGNIVYRAGGTDVPVTDGGTGSSTASGARTNLGLAIGTDVQAFDAELQAIAGLVSAADKLPYFTGSGTAALTTLSSFIRTLLDDVDAITARATLGLTIGTNVQAWDADLDTIAGLTATTDNFMQAKAGAWASRTVAQVITDLAAGSGGVLLKANNLSDVAAAGTSRYNLHDQVLAAVNAVATSNVASKSGTTTIDGVSLVAGDLVLLTAQSTGAENGPWTINAGAWTRPADYPAAGTVRSRLVQVQSGTLYAGTLWESVTTGIITVDTTATTWQRVSTVDVQTFTSGTGTWTRPLGTKAVTIVLIGGGGQGGGGRGQVTAANVKGGGGGGGGGAVIIVSLSGADAGSSQTVTIGAGGSGAGAGGSNANGSTGSNGSNSTFGSLLTAGGGQGGGGGTSTAGGAAGNGGSGGTEFAYFNTAGSVTGGGGIAGGGGVGGTGIGAATLPSGAFIGGGSAAVTMGLTTAGGGGGAGLTSADGTETSFGGGYASFGQAAGGAGVANVTSGTGNAGGAGTASTSHGSGGGGAGGGSRTTGAGGTAGVGGAGALYGAGGGGGGAASVASGTGTGGAGGNGAGGFCMVISWL